MAIRIKNKTNLLPSVLRALFICLVFLSSFRILVVRHIATSSDLKKNESADELFDQPSIRQHAISNEAPTAKLKTLALLYPPGLIGGYRNQVMRFVAFVRYAIIEKIPTLLLPSIYFSTTYEENTKDRIFYPIPMEDVFDVDHWNSFKGDLPTLVKSLNNHHSSDCWMVNQQYQHPTAAELLATAKKYASALDLKSPASVPSPLALAVANRSEFLTPLVNISLAITKGFATLKRPRKIGLGANHLNCSNPIVYGGGGGAGVLWDDYVNKIKKDPVKNEALVKSISQALRPALRWRRVAEQCIQQDDSDYDIGQTNNEPYFALHARVELEMMRHKCGRSMEMNLTKIFSFLDSMIADDNQNQNSEHQVRRVFLAVSRQGMLEAKGLNSSKEERMANHNLETLMQRISPSNDRSKAKLFECGEQWMHKWYTSMSGKISENYYGSLIPMIMNFYIATEATVFIGVSKSSWSTDVWTTRYYQGKGDKNFQYTPQGIVPVSNGGLPPPHGNC